MLKKKSIFLLRPSKTEEKFRQIFFRNYKSEKYFKGSYKKKKKKNYATTT